MAKGRKRRLKSVSNELLYKSREAVLSAVQIFNSPQILFKSELFVVTMIIGWTYLLHAYYRRLGVDYRYFSKGKKKRVYSRTKSGSYKYWELERCLDEAKCPLDGGTKHNLKFLIGLRHEIEHQMTTRIDQSLSAKFQACCLNFNRYVKEFFGEKYGIDKHLSFSLQFSSISKAQADQLAKEENLPPNILSYMRGFEENLSDEEYNSQEFAYRVLFVAKTANKKGQADQVIEFVKADTELASQVNKTYALIKETERPKYTPGQVVKIMRDEGFHKFRVHEHTEFWRAEDAKNPGKGFGTQVATTWYWYESWIEHVRKHCVANRAIYEKGV